MGEIIEEFFNGYCRNFDMTQTVICEYEQLPQESFILLIQAVNLAPANTAKTALS